MLRIQEFCLQKPKCQDFGKTSFVCQLITFFGSRDESGKKVVKIWGKKTFRLHSSSASDCCVLEPGNDVLTFSTNNTKKITLAFCYSQAFLFLIIDQ